MKTISYDEWVLKYKPKKNIFVDNCSHEGIYDDIKHFDYVRSHNNKFIWTLVSSENEEMWILPGYHFVDRMGYFLTEEPWEDENIQVNDNEMISIEQAVEACITFFKKFNIQFSKEDVLSYFIAHKDKTFENQMSTGKAKYTSIDFYNEMFDELTPEMENEIHDFFNQL